MIPTTDNSSAGLRVVNGKLYIGILLRRSRSDEWLEYKLIMDRDRLQFWLDEIDKGLDSSKLVFEGGCPF